MSPEPDSDPKLHEFCPVENEAPLRWWRVLRVAPRNGLGTWRRTLLAAVVTWAPIMAWGVATGRVPPPAGSESVLYHFGVHVRCLLAIPLLIAGELVLHAVLGRISGRIRQAGIVPDDRRASVDAVNASIRRLRDASLPWLIIIGVAVASAIFRPIDLGDDQIAWALDPNGGLGFGGWWYVYVARPVYVALMLGWMWRLALVTRWFSKLARLDLSLVPTHPDRMGGMSIVHMVPTAFAPFTGAAAAVIAAEWAHRIVSHGAQIKEFGVLALTFTVLWCLLLLLPLLMLSPVLIRARREAIAAYGALVGEHGRLAHRRWIDHEDVGDPPLLSAPELGPIADTASMYQAVIAMQTLPVGKKTFIGMLAPIALPFLAVTTLEIPLSELLKQVFNLLA